MNKELKVAVCSRSFSKNSVLRHELLDQFPNTKFNDEGISLKDKALIDFLNGAEAAIVALETINGNTLEQLPNLKIISKYGVGLDQIDLPSLEEKGILLGWIGGVNKRAVAELTMAFAINLLREIIPCNRKVKEGTWKQNRGRELSSMTVGIIGCGNVGKEVVKRMHTFDAKILVHDIREYPEFYQKYNIKSVDLEKLVENSDIICVHVPLDSSTKNILDNKLLSKMKKNSYLINTARGGIVCEKTVEQMLISGHLMGAAFDVFESEPTTNKQLINLPNFLCTPHIGGSTKESVLAMGRAAIDGLSNAKLVSTYEEIHL